MLTLLIIALVALALALLPSVSPAHILAEQVSDPAPGVHPVQLNRRPLDKKSPTWLIDFLAILLVIAALVEPPTRG